MAIIQITDDTLALFERRRFYHQPQEGRRWRAGVNISVARDAVLEPYSHVFAGDRLPAALGAFSYSHSGLREWLKIGRYVSIGPNVGWLEGDHPDEWATSSPITYDLAALRGLKTYFRDRGVEPALRPYPQSTASISIGHDVWIGHSALIARGVKIGTGAVVGARSLVLEDVPPYSVVFGSPAKIQRTRFPPDVAERLLLSKWWTLAPELIQALPVESPERFAAQAAEQPASARISFKPLTSLEIYESAVVLTPD